MLVEQNARMALELAHYAYVIELGRIPLQGTGKDLASDPNVQKTFLGG
jgi:branched-chain amino acid transport system ATP-binding protein